MPTSHQPSDRSGTPGKRPPSTHAVLGAARSALPGRNREAVRSLVRELIAEERSALTRGEVARPADALADELVRRLETLDHWEPTSVINATGVILHTNLGRAPWAPEAVRAGARAATGYLFLELEQASGRRGTRFAEAEAHLEALTGAPAALVVNNNAAAVMLSVGALARRSAVVVSRGELAEIGGGVRVPEMIRRAGVRLVEVGTTNKTHLADYEEALRTGHVRAVLRVHASNFRIEGFTERPRLSDLVELAHSVSVPVIEDLGSGALLDTAPFGLTHEPMPGESLASGVDLVTFSGDKLVGGPQAGIVVGSRDVLARLRRDPLARAVRADKVSLAGLTATLAMYRSGQAALRLPVWRMIAADPAELERRARSLATTARGVRVEATRATVGGGSLPGETLPSFAVAIPTRHPDRLHARLRSGAPAVIGHVEASSVVLDLRTVLPEEDPALEGVLQQLDAGSV